MTLRTIEEAVWRPERQERARKVLGALTGCPHVDYGRDPATGMDCIQSVVYIHVECGIVPDVPFRGYSTDDGLFGPSDNLFRAVSESFHVEQLACDSPVFGAICVFRNGNRSSHVGFFADDRVWHVRQGHVFDATDWQAARGFIVNLFVVNQDGWLQDPKTTVRRALHER